MRTRTALSLAFATVTAASLTFFACSKDKDDEEEGLSAEQKADGNKVASATAGKVIGGITSGMQLKGQQVGAQLRTLYSQAKLARGQMMALQSDDPETQEDPLANFDLCASFATMCTEEEGKDQPADADGMACKVTSCSNGGRSETCASPSSTTQCGGTTYTMSASTVDTTVACTKVADKQFNLSIGAHIAGAISGGSFNNTKLECKFNLDFPIDLGSFGQPTASDSSTETSSDSESEEIELSCAEGQFSCTLDGAEMSCEEMKAAIADNPCDDK